MLVLFGTKSSVYVQEFAGLGLENGHWANVFFFNYFEAVPANFYGRI